jgi:hypothetical protein
VSGVPVVIAAPPQQTECQRCGLARAGLREVTRYNPHLDKDVQYRWCASCRGEGQDQAATQDGEPDDAGELRRCPSCERDKPPGGWAPGWIGLTGRIAPVCVDCQPPKPPDVAADHPRFCAQLTMDPTQRRILAGELVEIGQGHPVLAAIISQLEAAGDRSGPVELDVDVADLSLADRSRIGLALEAAILVRHPSVHAIRRAWLDWLLPQLRAAHAGAGPAAPAGVGRSDGGG